MLEIWKSVVGFEGLYEVSSLGRVKSVKRLVLWRGSRRSIRERLLRQKKNRSGYLVVVIYRHSQRYFKTVHSLVLEAFVGPRLPMQETRHLDGNRINNHFGNLLWGTHADNTADKIRHGTQMYGENHHATKLKECDVRYIRASNMRQIDLAAKFGVSQQLISKIRCNGCWEHL